MARFGNGFQTSFAFSHAPQALPRIKNFRFLSFHNIERVPLSQEWPFDGLRLRCISMRARKGNLFGTAVASLWDMAYATYKSVAVSPIQSSLTPCIFDDDPNERDSLAPLITDTGYASVSR